MHIQPKRRRRCLKVHALTLQGLSQRKIAEQLNVSHATVRADQQLIETHWSEIAAPAADDLLLQQLDLLRRETARIARQDIMETFGNHITMAEYIKACDARDAKILAYLRETRRTIDAIHRRAKEREAQPDLYQDEDQNDAETTQELAETSSKLAQTVHPNSASPQPEQEIVAPDAPEEKIPEKTVQPASDPLLRSHHQGSHQPLPPAQRPIPRPNPRLPRPTHRPNQRKRPHPRSPLRRSRRRLTPCTEPRPPLLENCA